MHTSVCRKFIVLVAFAFVAIMAMPASSYAGNYLVRECSDQNPGHPDWSSQISTNFFALDFCSSGSGFSKAFQTSAASNTGANSITYFTGSHLYSFAPPGTRLDGLNVEMAMETDDYNVFNLDDNLDVSMNLGNPNDFTIQARKVWSGPLNSTGNYGSYESASISNTSATPSYSAFVALACGTIQTTCSGYPVNFLGSFIGPWANWRNLVTTINDYTAPTATIGGAVTDGGWKSFAKYPGGQTVTSTGADVGGGVKFTVFQLDGSPFHAQTRCVVGSDGFYTSYQPCLANVADSPTINYATLTDGNHSIYYQVYDVGDNQTNTSTASIRVDNTVPSTPSRTSGNSRNLVFTGVSDATSGLDAAQTYAEVYNNTLATWVSVTGTNNGGAWTGTVPTSIPSGATQIRFKLVDNAGNTKTTASEGIVFAAPAPSNTAVPTVTPGNPYTGSNGTWDGAPTGYTYQWQRCSSSNVSSCSDIGGATKPTYAPSADDNDKQLRLCVTATNAAGSTTSCSALTPTVSYTGPTNTSPPTAKINPSAGTGTGTPGTWDGDLTGIDYQWQRCPSADVSSCNDIAGATKALYTLTSADAGQQLRLCVTARTTTGASTVCSPLTAAVASSCRVITGTKTKWVVLHFKKGKKHTKTKVYFSSAKRLTKQSFIKVSVDHKKSTKKMIVRLNGKSVKGKNKRFLIKPWQLSTSSKQWLKVTIKDGKTGKTKTAKHSFRATACK